MFGFLATGNIGGDILMGYAKEIRVITPVVLPDAGNIAEEFAAEISKTAVAKPAIQVSQRIIEAGTPSIESEYDEIWCAPHTLSLSIQAEKEGADAIVIDCMSDPALGAAREAVGIPVVGPCQAAMHTASLLAGNFGIVVLNSDVAPIFEKLARVYGFENKLKEIKPAEIHACQIRSMMKEDPIRLYDTLTSAVMALIENGAQSVILGCTGFLGCAHHIRKALSKKGLGGVPVIDPIPNAIVMASALVDLGLSQSSKSFPRPEPQLISGFDKAWTLL